jgi:hypothetical protein
MPMEAIEEAFAAALLDPALPVPAGLKSSGPGHATDRFAVYRNNVAVGLRKALASNFPVVARLVGEAFFAALAHAYAGTRRPASPLLFTYGADFADFIDGFEPARRVPYLADVARLEFARLGAHHAADAGVLAIPALAGLDPAMLEAARLRAHPAAALLASRFPVGSIWLAHQGNTIGAVCGRGPERVLVTRPDIDVGITRLQPAEFNFAQALFAGAAAGEAATLAAGANFDFGRAMVMLTSAGAFSEIMSFSTEIS